MDHRTIVSFFTCQLVWVNRYSTRHYYTNVTKQVLMSLSSAMKQVTRLIIAMLQNGFGTRPLHCLV